ncbi:MAG TPA: hypothetical protein VFM53_05945 [Anaeromyxobacteraceae bacterium]|nr:hypothetical protein [Anaeromyxobacteraceae bacterium]
MRRTLLVGLALAVSCAHSPTRPAAPAAPAARADAPPPPGTVSIRVERLPAGSGWLVTWRLPQPVQELRFSRAGYGDRKRQWILRTPGLAIVSEGDRDRVVSASAPFQAFEASIVEYARKPEKDYQAFIPFTDGTVLLYTGVLDVEGPAAQDPWTLRFELVPRAGEAVVVGGARHVGPATWVSRGEGTYAAFGSPPIHDTPFGMAVVDGGMPAWLRDRTLLLAPQLFAHYAARTGWRLDVRPVLFLSYGREEDPGALSFGGGTLPGVVQVDARMGSRFSGEADPTVWERQSRLLAHEAAHLWLSNQFRPADGASRWLDEGGADAWALRALNDLDVLTRERFAELVKGEANECLRLLQDGPLSTAGRPGRWNALYRCGAVASLLTEAAGARRDPPWDLLQFWGQVFFDASFQTYDEALWLDTVSSLPGGVRVADVVRRMIDRPDPALAADVRDLLQFAQ